MQPIQRLEKSEAIPNQIDDVSFSVDNPNEQSAYDEAIAEIQLQIDAYTRKLESPAIDTIADNLRHR